MSDTAREITQEYWRPAQPPKIEFTGIAEPGCDTCGTQFAPGARFCHVCGASREPEFQDGRIARFANALDFTSIRQRLGLSTASLVLAFVAAGCVLATLLIGFIYDASTLVEWQAVQTWRIEWMLASLVALVAAVLFKGTPESHQ